jgi:glutamate--cysteine ligase
MVWLASTPKHDFTQKDQVKAIQNFKNAARYDLKTVKIMTSDGKTLSVAQAAMDVIDKMKVFYHKLEIDVEEILDFQYNKFVDASNRYAWQIREQFQDGYVKKALELAKKRQERKQCVNYSE